jgi:anti-anti-sigma factor
MILPIASFEPPKATASLDTVLEWHGDALVITARGEVDAYTEPRWRRLLLAAATQARPPGPLVVDTSKLDFMGTCAFAVLAEQAESCRQRGVSLHLVSDQLTTARIVAVCGFEQLRLFTSVEAALGAPTRTRT